LSTKMQEVIDKNQQLEREVEQLRTENTKLKADMKVIRSEQSEVMHSVFKVEQHLETVTLENDHFRRRITT